MFVYHDEISNAFAEHEIYLAFEDVINVHINPDGGAGGTAAGLTGIE